jgi:arylsulfatase A-like enzyme
MRSIAPVLTSLLWIFGGIMKRRTFLQTSALTAAALGTGALNAAEPRRPNVIVILTDDQGYGDFSFTGNPILKTPSTDKLAAQSAQFTDFHVTPVCTPTRSQLMTGNDCLHNLACAVTAGRTIPRRDMPNMAELLKKAGYATGLFGKWHLGHSYPDRPMDRGFDKAVWFRGYGLNSEIEFDNDYVTPRYLDDLVEKRSTKYCTNQWFDSAMDFIKAQRAASKPFFTYIATNTPHLPMYPPEDYMHLYEGKVPAQAQAFFAMIANFEDNLGRLDQLLKDSGIFDDTIVVFSTDNGGTLGRATTNAGLRDGKSSHYDGGHRVPCLIRYPAGGINQNLQVNTPTQIQDVLPTVLDLCGIAPGSTKFDGASLVPLMKGRSFPDRMFVMQFGLREKPVKYEASVVWNKWRLQKGTELYDMEADRAQTKNVAAQNPDVVARMRAFYDAWWARLEPGFGKPIPVVLGSGPEKTKLLTSVEWWEVDCDNIDFVSRGDGGPRGGPWHVDVQTAGTYRFELRRWPFHTNMPLGSEGARKSITGRALTQRVKQMPAHSIMFMADGAEQKIAVKPEDLGGTVEVKLAKGPHVLQSWLRDAEGKDLCGAYYAQVTKV